MRSCGLLTAVVALGLLGAAGCGGSEQEQETARPTAAAPADPAAALRQAPARLRETGPFAFSAEFVETKRAGKDVRTRYLTLDGALDLAKGEGRNVVDLTWLARELELLRGPNDPPPGSDPDSFGELFGKPVEVFWNEQQVFVRLRERWSRGPRAGLGSGGLLGTAAQEPEQLVELLARAEDVRFEGEEEVDGERTSHVLFTVDARRAGAAGVPAELHGAFAQALHGPVLQLEAWLDATGLPRRLAYTVEKDEVHSGGRVAIPAKTIRVEYALSGFGGDHETAPPRAATR